MPPETSNHTDKSLGSNCKISKKTRDTEHSTRKKRGFTMIGEVVQYQKDQEKAASNFENEKQNWETHKNECLRIKDKEIAQLVLKTKKLQEENQTLRQEIKALKDRDDEEDKKFQEKDDIIWHFAAVLRHLRPIVKNVVKQKVLEEGQGDFTARRRATETFNDILEFETATEENELLIGFILGHISFCTD